MKVDKNNSGFTLVELLVVTAVFSILMIAIAAVYLAFSKDQVRTKISQRLLNNSQYALEIMAREIKNDYIFDLTPSDSECADLIGGGNVIYSNCILLVRESGQMVTFFKRAAGDDDQKLFYVVLDCNSDYSSCSWGDSESYTQLLGESINDTHVENLDFHIMPITDPYDGNSNQQPRVTILLETSYHSDKDIEAVSHSLQTTVSSRVYRR